MYSSRIETTWILTLNSSEKVSSSFMRPLSIVIVPVRLKDGPAGYVHDAHQHVVPAERQQDLSYDAWKSEARFGAWILNVSNKRTFTIDWSTSWSTIATSCISTNAQRSTLSIFIATFYNNELKIFD